MSILKVATAGYAVAAQTARAAADRVRRDEEILDALEPLTGARR
ncbi:hypothetical protein [Streptomyces sp. WM6372]|nr:hypothetical protein [Streptomyces sp. WM6372]